MITSILNPEQIKKSEELLNRIRSDEGELLSDYVNREEDTKYDAIENGMVRFFDDDENEGVFASLIFFGMFRIFIAFEKDTDKYTQELAELIHSAKEKNSDIPARVYFIAEQKKLIEGLQQSVKFDQENYYAAHEFIMDRKHFKGFANDKNLEIKPFEADKIGDYALLLDNAMTFVSPPANFQGNLAGLAERLERVKENAFYTFYKDGELVGLYWLDNDFYTIDIMAVAPAHQRKGYGSIILSHAINNVFTEQKIAATGEKFETAKLYCVDWNEKGLAFYKKYGMIKKGHTYAVSLAEIEL